MDIFKPDIFSKSKPKWAPSSLNKDDCIKKTIFESFQIPKMVEIKIDSPSTNEVNSANYRISFLNKKYVLKRWSRDVKKRDLLNMYDIIFFLNMNKIPVPITVLFKNNNKILNKNDNFWTCSEYIKGEYFSGKNNQFQKILLLTVQTTNILQSLPKAKYPKKEVKYDKHKIIEIIKKTEKLNSNWRSIFGEKTSIILKRNWDKINQICGLLKNNNLSAGPVYPSHYDLHPHNVLFNKNEIACLLDFESIIKIPIGYSIAYSALKQCRQLVSFTKDLNSASQIGNFYIDFLSDNLNQDNLNWLENFKILAQTETLRRIMMIFELNLQKKSNWNKVLPTLISHLYEAEELFK